ncbi:MAG: SMI1/KNR4 family protein, partial [Pirellulales bacterium]|nr:SMI1/KNR4 family protein [Pirellulales bacterium]
MLELERSGPKVSDTEISQFEKEFNITIPFSYHSFLQRHNGGMPVGRIAYTHRGEESDILSFFSLLSDDGLRKHIKEVRPRNPGLLPIAINNAAEYICLDEEGKVYTVGFGFFGDDLENAATLVSNSFTEF